MVKEVITELIRHWRLTFYVEPLLTACQLSALLIGIIYYQKETLRTAFVIFVSFSVLLTIIAESATISFAKQENTQALVITISNVLFEIVEFFSFFVFFSHVLRSKGFKQLMKIYISIFLFFVFLFFFKIIFDNPTIRQMDKYTDIVSSSSLLLFILACVTYFFELFEYESFLQLEARPSFWIVTAILFYSVYSVPFLLISQNIRLLDRQLYFHLYSGHYLTFSFVFIMLAKSFRCKKPLTI